MYYATAGQQATQPPPSSRGGINGYPRGGPPGFSTRPAADPNDFPALGSLPQHNSTYASQAQPSSTTGTNQIQQLYLQQQQQMGGPPPPPPGISPNPSIGQGQAPGQGQGQTNGGGGDEFPALSGGGDSKEARLATYLRNPPNPSHPQQGQASSPSSQTPQVNLPNGSLQQTIPSSSVAGTTNTTNTTTNTNTASGSTTQSTNATPLTNPPQLTGNLQQQQQQQHNNVIGENPNLNSNWQSNEPLTRPVQQILSSPVDKWGLKALLYEIQIHMNKTDRGLLVFGEELEDLGLDISGEDSLYPSFVTPWADSNSLSQPPRIEESYHIPQCYNVHAPPVSTKLPNFTEDTLFLAFFMSPGDVLQLEVAEELYARGWRYHTDLQTWITSPTLTSIDLLSLTNQSNNEGTPQWIRGPFMYLDTRTWTRQRTNEDFNIDVNLLEITRSASLIISEDKSQSQSQSQNQSQNQNSHSSPNSIGNLPIPQQQQQSGLVNSNSNSNSNSNQSYTR